MLTYRIRPATGIAFFVCIVLLTGCAKNASSVNPITDTIQEDSLITPDPALESAQQIQSISPCILVDQNGYRTGALKTVLFKRDKADNTSIPTTFEIRRLSDDSTVFTGTISWPRDMSLDSSTNVSGSDSSKESITSDTKLQDSDEYVASGTFTDFQTDGEYYIYAEGMGESCSFSIGNDVYNTLYESALRQYYLNRCGIALTQEYAKDDARGICHSDLAKLEDNSSVSLDITGGWHLDFAADRDVVTGCLIIDNLLLAYEMNPDVFANDYGIPESGDDVPDILDEVRYEIDWLLKMQDTKSGGVYASALTSAKEGENLSMADVVVTDITAEATISFAATLAWFSYVYSDIDSDYCDKCLEAAISAFEAAKSMGAIGSFDASFLASAQLYRMTGQKTYENGLTLYFKSSSFDSDFVSKDSIFMGGICYLRTNKPVNKEICSKIMEDLMNEAEKISVASKKSDYMISTDDYENTGVILRNMRCLTVTNHIIYSQEYVEIIENHAHYLLGRGPLGANLATDTTEYTYKDIDAGTGILYDPILDAELLILLSAIM